MNNPIEIYRVKRLIISNWDIATSVILGFFITLATLGYGNLNPRNIGWITGDNWTAYIAQLYYLSDDWHFPLGANPNYGLENTTTLTYTGPSPILLIIGKVFRINPQLQFFGIWILINLVLQLILASRIAREFTLIKTNIIFFSLLTLTPFLFFRIQMHFWLVSHFLILWAFLILIRQFKQSTISTRSYICLLFLGYTINIYLLIMIIIVLIIGNLYLSLVRKQLNRYFHLLTIAFFVLLSSFLIIDGGFTSGSAYESARTLLTPSYGAHPANLFSFIDSNPGLIQKKAISFDYLTKSWSIIKWNPGNIKGDYEGMGYLGIGNISLVALATFLFVRNKSWKLIKIDLLFLLPSFLCLILYTITFRIGFGSKELDLPFPIVGKYALSLFRTSGRFIWIFCYLILIASFAYLLRNLGHRIFKFILIAVLAFQLMDISYAMIQRYSLVSKIDTQTLDEKTARERELFKKIAVGKLELRFWPQANEPTDWEYLDILAWQNSLATDGTLTSRQDFIRMNKLDVKTKVSLCSNNLNKEIIYSVAINSYAELKNCGLNLEPVARVRNSLLFSLPPASRSPSRVVSDGI